MHVSAPSQDHRPNFDHCAKTGHRYVQQRMDALPPEPSTSSATAWWLVVWAICFDVHICNIQGRKPRDNCRKRILRLHPQESHWINLRLTVCADFLLFELVDKPLYLESPAPHAPTSNMIPEMLNSSKRRKAFCLRKGFTIQRAFTPKTLPKKKSGIWKWQHTLVLWTSTMKVALRKQMPVEANQSIQIYGMCPCWLLFDEPM